MSREVGQLIADFDRTPCVIIALECRGEAPIREGVCAPQFEAVALLGVYAIGQIQHRFHPEYLRGSSGEYVAITGAATGCKVRPLKVAAKMTESDQ